MLLFDCGSSGIPGLLVLLIPITLSEDFEGQCLHLCSMYNEK